MLKIYDYKIKNKKEFIPLKDKKVLMYVCGPTLYSDIHIGNARPIIFFDFVYRVFKILNYDIKYISNITDIDDKIIQYAIDNSVAEKEVVDKNYNKFKKILKKINILEINLRPKITDYMDDIIKYIEKLIEQKYAYVTKEGNVYFKVDKIDNYGSISGRNINDLITGTRIDVDKQKENELDFSLWKHTKEGITWNASFGKGRPGWHTECSVLIQKLLGSKIDIHGGGTDLKFPHHENENAQNRALYDEEIANYWMHNGLVNIDNEKMSKSKNNFVKVEEFLEEYNANVLRLLLLQSSYRQPININENFVNQTVNLEKKIKQYTLEKKISTYDYEDFIKKNNENIDSNILEYIQDDFNSSNLITYLLKKIKEKEDKQVEVIINLLGLEYKNNSENILSDEIDSLIKEREIAKQKKNYEKADEIKKKIVKQGYKVIDLRGGTKVEKI